MHVSPLLLHYHITPAISPQKDQAQACPVLFLHGLGSHSGDWSRQSTALSHDRDVILMDLRAHGRSPLPETPGRGAYSLEAYRSDVLATLDCVFNETTHPKVHLVGLSLGSVVAAELALHASERFATLTLVNMPLALRPNRLADFIMGVQRLAFSLCLPPHTMAKIMVDRLFPKPEQASLRAEVLANFRPVPKYAYTQTLLALRHLDLRADLARIPLPSLIVGGDRDYWPVSEKQQQSDLLPQGRLAIIADSGHATPLDQPEAFNATLAAFLNEVDVGAHQV